MYTYRIISEATGAPEMADLEADYVEQPSQHGSVFHIRFFADYSRNPVPYEQAVGVRCKVIRTDESGRAEECGGAVARVTPYVEVSLDGAGFREAEA